jgi:hypothetical protein
VYCLTLICNETDVYNMHRSELMGLSLYPYLTLACGFVIIGYKPPHMVLDWLLVWLTSCWSDV